MALYDRSRVAERFPGLRPGFYVTDSKRLYRVLDADQGHVLLENARVPDENPGWIPRSDLVDRDMRLVRPS